MNEYTATNGCAIKTGDRLPTDYIELTIEHPDDGDRLNTLLKPREWEALREFFRTEEDKRLGRWRWSAKPNYFVIVDEDGDVEVFDEERPAAARLYARESVSFEGNFGAAARAYFDAHPEPKPWHNAKEGDVWEFNLGREHFDIFTGLPYSREMTRLFQRTTGGWRVIGRKNWFLNESEISEARPVWSYPEGDS